MIKGQLKSENKRQMDRKTLITNINKTKESHQIKKPKNNEESGSKMYVKK